MKYNKTTLVPVMFGLSSTYAFAQQTNENTQQESTMDNLSEVLQ
ncbi:hypothetical protein [Paraglaciecola algarum]|nr:hypothetical protein [Paraglaciecola sp. G1-23]